VTRRRVALMWLAAAIALAALAMFPSGPRSAGAQDVDGEDLTFQGKASTGGTISLTVTADRTGVTRAAVTDVTFSLPPPGQGVFVPRTLVYFDPPRPIVDGEFSVIVPDLSSNLPHRMWVALEGGFVSDGEASGSARYCGIVPPLVTICTLDVTWSATGPVDMPPGPDDVLFEGAVEGGNGRIVLTTDSSRAAVTSVTLDAVSVLPCTDPENPLDIRAFFEPSLPVSPADQSFQVGIVLASLEAVVVTGTLLDDGRVEGMLQYRAGIFTDDCTIELRWSAQGPPIPEPSATPTETATPLGGPAATPAAAPSPTSSVLPKELPAAGAAGGRQTQPPPALVVLAGLGLITATAGGMGRAAWCAWRRLGG